MLIRIILFLILIFYHKQIYNFFKKNHKNFNLNKINKSIEDFLYEDEFKPILIKLKKYDKKIYKEIKHRLNDIENIYKKKHEMKLQNTYENIREQRREILNLVSSLVCKIGLSTETNKDLDEIKNIINNRTKILLDNILQERDNKGYNTEWFEEKEEKVQDFDPNINYNYSIF